jgi:hypothetical protein
LQATSATETQGFLNMLSSCQADTENQPDTTIVNNGSDTAVTPKSISVLTIRQMCKRAPHAFQVNWPNSKPTQTLEQWAAL